jgi:pimeloyl-ACP methyl ester carboxylesterase
VESTRVTLDTDAWGALTFDVLVAGPADGEPVILLHGFPETARSWRHQIEALSAAGYRVVAPDQRGYSPSARPSDVSAYAIGELISDVLGLADSLSIDRFHLVGHDWGAALAWQVAGRHADRLRSLTILSVPHPKAFGMSLGEDASGEQAQRSSYVAMFQAEGSELGMLANDAVGLRLIYLGSGLSEEEAAPYLEAMGTPDALGAALNWYRASSLTDVMGLGPITTPTLYVWSTEDPALGREAAEATADCVEGPYTFVVLDGVDHWIGEHAPDETNRLLLEHLRSAPT